MNTRAPVTPAALAVSLILLLSCAGLALAQTAARTPGVGRAFRGWVGSYPVRMTLRRGAGVAG